MGYRSDIDPSAGLGLQPEQLGGALVFVIPSSSAANAGFTREERLDWFQKLHALRERLRTGGGDCDFPGDILDPAAGC